MTATTMMKAVTTAMNTMMTTGTMAT